MTVNNELNASANALKDSELEKANGGIWLDPGTTSVENVFDKKGRVIGFKLNGTIYYWQCTHCGCPVHKNVFYYCDKCDDWWLSRNDYVWNDTEEQLIAAAN